MKIFYLYVTCMFVGFAHTSMHAANRYWVGASTYMNNYNITTDLNQWALTDDNGTGSWTLTTRGTAILKVDNILGGFANRLFNVNGALPRLLPLDKINGVVSFQVVALTGPGQRFYLQVEEYNASGALLNQQTILAPNTAIGTHAVALSGVTWNAATTQVRFILAADNQLVQQGTVEFNYFNYTSAVNSWANTANWSTSSGGASGASAPGAADVVFFDGASAFHEPCYLTANVVVAGINLNGYTGTIDLRGFNLSSTGANTFNTGNIATNSSGSLILNASTGNVTTFAGTSFHTAVSGSSGGLLFNGSYFNNVVNLTKTGTSNNNGAGGNVFQAAVTLTNSAAGAWRFANPSPDIFNGTLTLNVSVTAAASIDLSYTATGNQFNDNVVVNFLSAGSVNFGGVTGTSTLAAGKTITVGSCVATCGSLSLAGVATGTTAQTITFPIIGTGSFRTALASVWNGDLTVTAGTVLLDGATFNGTTTITKNGTGTDASIGGNAFNGTTNIINSGVGGIQLATGTGDAFNGNVTFTRFGGTLEPAYNGTNSFTANVTTNSSTTITFGAGVGNVTFTGTNAQALTRAASTAGPIINRLTMSKSSGLLTLSTPLTIGVSASFVAGIIDVVVGNYISFDNNATVSNAKNASHVDGIVKKSGNTDFTFPVGDASVYRPITITAPVLASVFAAQFFKTPQLYGNAKVGTLSAISNCEYWVLDRESGLGVPLVTLSWTSIQCNATGYVSDPVDLRVAHWNGSFWDDYGTSGYSGNSAAGTVSTASAVLFFSPFALASATPDNPLPVTLDNFKGIAADKTINLFWETATELNNDYFTILRSADGTDFEEIGMREGAGTSNQRQHYTFRDRQPLSGVNYYKLKQTDFDKQVRYSEIIAVNANGATTEDDFYVYPNPADHQWITFNYPTGFRVMNGIGELVLEGREAPGFDASALHAGLYWVVSDARKAVKLIIH